MSEPIRRIRPGERTKDTTQTSGMVREAAVERDGLWSGWVRALPGMASGWHHHGAHETVIYVLSGAIRLEFGRGGAQQVDGTEGDFLFVPPHAVHRESNQAAGESSFVVTRAGRGAPVVNVEGPEV